MTEVEKMRSSQLADMSAPELQERFEHAKKLLAVMRGLSTYDDGYRELLEELVPGIPETSVICPPFHCDHGDGIRLGEHVFVNANCTFLDGGYITIGAHTLVGPCVQIYTPHHPMNYLERRGSKEYAYPVTVGEVEFYLVNGTGGNGYKSLFAAFSFHFDEALVEIKIGQLEVDKF